MTKLTRNDRLVVLFTAGITTCVAPLLGVGDPERSHLYVGVVFGLLLCFGLLVRR